MVDKKAEVFLVFLFVPFVVIPVVAFILGASIFQLLVMFGFWTIILITFFNFALLMILYDELLPDKMNMER